MTKAWRTDHTGAISAEWQKGWTFQSLIDTPELGAQFRSYIFQAIREKAN